MFIILIRLGRQGTNMEQLLQTKGIEKYYRFFLLFWGFSFGAGFLFCNKYKTPSLLSS